MLWDLLNFDRKIGANVANFIYEKNPPYSLDSKDDQYSIHLGYEWKKP